MPLSYAIRRRASFTCAAETLRPSRRYEVTYRTRTTVTPRCLKDYLLLLLMMLRVRVLYQKPCRSTRNRTVVTFSAGLLILIPVIQVYLVKIQQVIRCSAILLSNDVSF